jgi:hypothetical protein
LKDKTRSVSSDDLVRHVERIGITSAIEAQLAARAIFEARMILGVPDEQLLYGFEIALYREADRRSVKRRVKTKKRKTGRAR